MKNKKKPPGRKSVSYSRYGYLFIAPFFIAYLIFSLWPLLSTFYYSLFEYTTRNLRTTISFAGLKNYLSVLGISEGERGYFLTYLGNTLRLWIFNFIPQIILSLLAAAWLTDNRVKLKGGGLYKVMIYMPNIITAASISLLFCALLSKYGPDYVHAAQLGMDWRKYRYYVEQMGNGHLYLHDSLLDVVRQYDAAFDRRHDWHQSFPL